MKTIWMTLVLASVAVADKPAIRNHLLEAGKVAAQPAERVGRPAAKKGSDPSGIVVKTTKGDIELTEAQLDFYVPGRKTVKLSKEELALAVTINLKRRARGFPLLSVNPEMQLRAKEASVDAKCFKTFPAKGLSVVYSPFTENNSSPEHISNKEFSGSVMDARVGEMGLLVDGHVWAVARPKPPVSWAQ